MIQSLKKMRGLEVSLIVLSLYVGYSPFEKLEEEGKYHSAIDEYIFRLERGERHWVIKKQIQEKL